LTPARRTLRLSAIVSYCPPGLSCVRYSQSFNPRRTLMPDLSKRVRSGGCQCGALRYALMSEPTHTSICWSPALSRQREHLEITSHANIPITTHTSGHRPASATAYQSCAAIACAPTAGVCGIGQGARTAEYADSRSLAPCHRRHRSGDCAHARVTEVRFCTERDQRRRQGHLPAAVLVSIFALHERRKRFSDFGWTIFLNEMDSFDRKLSAG
jgi:hypothetical protein